MKRPVIAFAVLGIFALLYGWNAVLLAPRARQRAEIQAQLAPAEAQEQALRANLIQLRGLAAKGNTQADELVRLASLVPADPDLAGFIRALDSVAHQSKVDWSSLTPAEPTAGLGGAPTTVPLTINLTGTFFEVLDYMKRIQNLDRLVVIDSVDLSAATATGGTPKLAVNLRARIFAAAPDGAS